MLLTLTQYLAALNKEVQSLKNHKTITVKTKITQTKKHLGMEYPFGRKRDGNSNTSGHEDQVYMKEILATPRKRATRTRLTMQIVWADKRDGLKRDINVILGYIVVVWIRRKMKHITLPSSQEKHIKLNIKQ